MKLKITLTLATAAILFAWSPAGLTQAGADEPIALDEVVVTARKRTETLQDIPIAVDAFTQERIEQLSIDSVESLSKYTPSLQFDQGVLPMDTRPVIRGVTALRGRRAAEVAARRPLAFLL